MRWAVVWILVAGACRPIPEPCISSDACGAGQECLANHCVLKGSDPVSPEAKRHVLEPSAVAVVTASRPGPDRGLPPTASFGSRVEGAIAWYMDFAPEWPATSRIDRAFLLLSPASSTTAATRDVRVIAWRVAEPWSVADLTWHDQPARELPRAVGIASAAPPQCVRIDVTRIVEYWQRHPRSRHGLSLEAKAGAGHGIGFATGAGGGVGPRLEVYTIEETL